MCGWFRTFFTNKVGPSVCYKVTARAPRKERRIGTKFWLAWKGHPLIGSLARRKKEGGATGSHFRYQNQAHLGLLECSKRRRCLLVEATQLAWASWAATTFLLTPINRGRGAEQGGATSVIKKSLEIGEKNCFVKKIQAKVLP